MIESHLVPKLKDRLKKWIQSVEFFHLVDQMSGLFASKFKKTSSPYHPSSSSPSNEGKEEIIEEVDAQKEPTEKTSEYSVMKKTDPFWELVQYPEEFQNLDDINKVRVVMHSVIDYAFYGVYMIFSKHFDDPTTKSPIFNKKKHRKRE